MSIPSLPLPLTAAELLEREFLQLRARLLEFAAGLDRLDRATGDVTSDARCQQLLSALDDLRQPGSNRAERLQLVFSLPYDAQWKQRFAIQSGPAATNS